MKLLKFLGRDGVTGVGVVDDHQMIHRLQFGTGHVNSLAELLESEDMLPMIDFLKDNSDPIPLASVTTLAPIDQQEVWAAGVTYTRSKSARMEESEAAASCYDRVYEADRPELFMKATPHRVVGHGQSLRLRRDSKWNVPEPELTLVLNSHLQLVGVTIGNDMSSRDIEGDNPLYLPQAKVYNQCCSIGPYICLFEGFPPREQMGIRMQIQRGGEQIFSGETSVAQMARSFDDLIEWLGRDNSFPNGAFLMTGTGIVPDREFTLQSGDVVDIEIDGLGCLTNPVVQD